MRDILYIDYLFNLMDEKMQTPNLAVLGALFAQ